MINWYLFNVTVQTGHGDAKSHEWHKVLARDAVGAVALASRRGVVTTVSERHTITLWPDEQNGMFGGAREIEEMNDG